MSPIEESDFYTSFDILWDVGKYEEAIRLYESLGRPFWLGERVGVYYEHNHRPDLAMQAYEHMINAYLEMGPDILPIPGGPIELYKLGKWFIKTDPAKAEKYLRLYVQADEKNPGEKRKTMFKIEARQLLEESMENKRAFIQQRLKELEHCPDVVLLRGAKTVSNAIVLTVSPKNRVGLWWYQLTSGGMFFSVSTRDHFKLSEFVGIKWDDLSGSIRGAIFQKDDLNYLLVYKCDLPSEILEGRTLIDIFQKVQRLSGVEITGGIVDEEGCDLLGTRSVSENKT